MQKKDPLAIDKAIWGTSAEAGAESFGRRGESDSDSARRRAGARPSDDVIDLSALIEEARAQLDVRPKLEEAPAIAVNPLSIFPFGPPPAAESTPPPPADPAPQIRRSRVGALVVSAAVTVTVAALAVVAVRAFITARSDRGTAPATCAAPADPPVTTNTTSDAPSAAATSVVATAPPPSPSATPEMIRSTTMAPRSSAAPDHTPPKSHAVSSAAPKPAAPPSPPPAPRGDPCKGDLLCAMKRATGEH